jgi:hypothetical protein
VQELEPFYPSGAPSDDASRGKSGLAPSQVTRRLQQCIATGSDALDLGMAPHLHHTDFGTVYAAMQDVPGALGAIKTVLAGDNLLSAGGVTGLMELLKARSGRCGLWPA